MGRQHSDPVSAEQGGSWTDGLRESAAHGAPRRLVERHLAQLLGRCARPPTGPPSRRHQSRRRTRWDAFYKHLKTVRDAGAGTDVTYTFTLPPGASDDTILGDGNVQLRSALAELCFAPGNGMTDVRLALAPYPSFTFPSHGTMYNGQPARRAWHHRPHLPRSRCCAGVGSAFVGLASPRARAPGLLHRRGGRPWRTGRLSVGRVRCRRREQLPQPQPRHRLGPPGREYVRASSRCRAAQLLDPQLLSRRAAAVGQRRERPVVAVLAERAAQRPGHLQRRGHRPAGNRRPRRSRQGRLASREHAVEGAGDCAHQQHPRQHSRFDPPHDRRAAARLARVGRGSS